jgi:hypothetical protein
MTKIAAMLLVAASILAGCKTGEQLMYPDQPTSSVHN